ncbi:hypothetical protein Tsp_09410 [Trichinella spiralis]|uniref:hypothetical protein n=1 Tax=Trichinella spiralis TaxID=6334 RepID=UPI0001EFD33D|nr:hypothetical protein Tsp_09410 [Trichinella spiralis]
MLHICYNPNSNSNEQESAVIFQEFADEAHYEDANSLSMFKMEDAYYFYDIELAILGSSSSDYADYKSQTRQEYSRMSDEAYRTKRLSVTYVHCSYWSDASNSECPITLCQRLVCSLRLAAIDFSFSSKEAYSQFVTLAIMSLKI